MDDEFTRHPDIHGRSSLHNSPATASEASPQEGERAGVQGVQAPNLQPPTSTGSSEQTASNVLFWTRRAFVAGALLTGLLIFVPWVSSRFFVPDQASLWQLATGEERARGWELDLAASGTALLVFLSLSLYRPTEAGKEITVTRTRLALLPWVAFAATDLFWSYQVSSRQEYLSLEWGFWLTVLAVLGMFGVACFQVVSLRRQAEEEDFGPLKPLRKVCFVALGLLAAVALLGAVSIREGELYGLGIDSRSDLIAVVFLDMVVLTGIAFVGQSVGRSKQRSGA